ncbi:MAG: endonuclease/exonuclease/phosphatase family protein [Spirochaetaceae bacterium]|jgi:endonuclease/exonuclease/phosphatase family metal-dependent hydrolase|nr:endonuclease/exonuclease/phosphatase family protein [Spirochaetaceae bacterium]
MIRFSRVSRGGNGGKRGRYCDGTGSILAKLAFFLTVMTLGAGSAGCGFFSTLTAKENAAQNLSIAVWNVETLFDGEDDGIEYREYRAAAGWSAEKFRARLTAISRAVEALQSGGPDILALVEVENARILEDFASDAGKQFGYRYVSFAGNPGAALGLGILSRHPIAGTAAHSVTSSDGTTPRPVLEARFEIRGKPLMLMICHWKSKLGGEKATELLRRASARALVRRLREIAAECPGTPVVIMGDLNENHDEFYRLGGETLSALLPDDPEAARCAGGAQEDFLVLSGVKPPAPSHFPGDTVTLYSPWAKELMTGSYFYQNSWETIDHILLSEYFFDGTGWEFFDAEAVHREPFIRAAGYPSPYNPRTGSGLSDHLPLLLTLAIAE